MKRKQVWRYYCEYCNKSNCSASHMKHHEDHCTMNPQRKCGMCGYMDEIRLLDIPLMLKKLPDPSEYTTEDSFGISYDERYLNEVVLKMIQSQTSCPACILAVLRQAKIPVPAVTDFNFTEECQSLWQDVNADRNRATKGYY